MESSELWGCFTGLEKFLAQEVTEHKLMRRPGRWPNNYWRLLPKGKELLVRLFTFQENAACYLDDISLSLAKRSGFLVYYELLGCYRKPTAYADLIHPEEDARWNAILHQVELCRQFSRAVNANILAEYAKTLGVPAASTMLEGNVYR